MESIKHYSPVAMQQPLMGTDSKNVNVSKNYSASLVLQDGSDLIHLELGTTAQRPAARTAPLPPGGLLTTLRSPTISPG